MFKNKKEIQNAINSLHFKINEKNTIKNINKCIKKFKIINKINLNNVEPTNFPIEQSVNLLNQDNPIANNEIVEYIKTRKTNKDGYVVISKSKNEI